MNNKIFSILILASMAPLSVHTAQIKQPIQYNAEATQKLQQKLDSIENATQVLASEFLVAIDTLINQGADPNIGYTIEIADKKLFNPLLEYLMIGASLINLGKNLDLALIEKVTKNALEHGADPNAQSSVGGLLGKSVLGGAIRAGSPAQVQMLLNYGADLSAVKTRSGKAPQAVLEKLMSYENNSLQRAQTDADRLQAQNELGRLEQIRDIVKAAKQKNK